MWRVGLFITLELNAAGCATATGGPSRPETTAAPAIAPPQSVAALGRLVAAADVSDVNAVPFPNDKGREEYAKFLTLEHARAFAVAENGAWGYRAKRDNRAQAVAGALYNCNKAAHNVCRVYAVNNDVVYQRYAEFEQRSRALLEGLKQVTFSSSEYGDELHDFRVPSPEALHKED